jgi:class 3 adenylate cyclase
MGEEIDVTVSRLRQGEHEVPTGGCSCVWLTHLLSLFREKSLMQRGVKGPRKLYLSLCILGGITVVMFTLLGMLAYRNMVSERELLLQNALLQGYWIARALEMSHRAATQDHAVIMRKIIDDIKRASSVHHMVMLDERKQVLMASDQSMEGTLWRQPFANPPEHGNVVHRDRTMVDVVFPASFMGASLGTHTHPEGQDLFSHARWILLRLDVTEAYEHYRDMVTQKVLLAILVVLFGIAALCFVGVVQKYALAHASIEYLEKIKHHLARFVPGTVQRLIEANPEQPFLDKVERDVTVLFLDIEQYTTLAEAMAPEALNHLVERYFSAFLDTILGCGGEINETAGDGLMAIFTGSPPRTHAINATRAAMTIREQAQRFNATKQPTDPNILVNIGLCTGPVLLGATKMRTDAGQERLTYTASGMVTNTAARLCQLATHGDIYLSETTAHLVRHRFTPSEPISEHAKNISGELRVYKLP